MSSRATLLALGGAFAIAFTGVFVLLADVAPATAAFWRCVYALPFLGVLLAAIVVDERPSRLQVAGTLLVVLGVLVATSGGRREREAGVPAEA